MAARESEPDDADPEPASSAPTPARLTVRQVEVLTLIAAKTTEAPPDEGRQIGRTLDALSSKSLIVPESSAVADTDWPYRITEKGKRDLLASRALPETDDDQAAGEPEPYWPQVGDHVRSNARVPTDLEFEGCVKEVIRRRKAIVCVQAGVRRRAIGPIHRDYLEKVDDHTVICDCDS